MTAIIVFASRYHIIGCKCYLSFKRVDGLLHCVWVGAEVGVDIEAAEAGQHRTCAQVVWSVVGLLLGLLLDTGGLNPTSLTIKDMILQSWRLVLSHIRHY